MAESKGSSALDRLRAFTRTKNVARSRPSTGDASVPDAAAPPAGLPADPPVAEGQGPEWICINISPDPSPPMDDLPSGLLSRDWTIFLEAYRDEVLERLADLHTAVEMDKSKSMKYAKQEVQARRGLSNEIKAARDDQLGPHKEVLQLHALVMKRVKEAEEAYKKCEEAHDKMSIPAPASEKQALRATVQALSKEAVACFQGLQGMAMKLRTINQNNPQDKETDGALRTAMMNLILNFLQERVGLMSKLRQLSLTGEVAGTNAVGEEPRVGADILMRGRLERLTNGRWEYGFYELESGGWLVAVSKQRGNKSIRIHSDASVSVINAGLTNREHCFLLQPSRTDQHLFSARSAETCRNWITALQNAMLGDALPYEELEAQGGQETDEELLEQLMKDANTQGQHDASTNGTELEMLLNS